MKNFTLFLFILSPILLFAQQPKPSPGGVKGIHVWLKATPTGNNLQGYYRWQDFSGDSTLTRLYDQRGASYGNEFTQHRTDFRTYNFHPALHLSEGNRSKETLIKHTNLSQSTIIGVFAPMAEYIDADMVMYGLSGKPDRGVLFTKDKVVHGRTTDTEPLDYGEEYGDDFLFSSGDPEKTTSEFRETSLRIGSYYRAIEPNHTLWGDKPESVITTGGNYNPNNVNFTTSFEQSLFTNQRFHGYTSELIVFNRFLDPVERRQAETYLALKYGITLKMSYLGSDRRLLWDLDANKNYNNRVTGIIRDDASGLYQPVSTTSYEEAPYFSDMPGGQTDSFDGNNSYNLPSRYRLLVMGRQEANPTPDGSYLIWGDNDATVKTVNSSLKAGLKIMPRRWLANTNLDSTALLNNSPLWETTGVTRTPAGFKDTFVQDSGKVASYVVTSIPLQSAMGYIAWEYQRTGTPFTVKFGNKDGNVSTGDYGYHFDTRGDIYSVVNGERQPYPIARVQSQRKIEIHKTENDIYLRIAGRRLSESDIRLDEPTRGKQFHAALIMEIGSSPLTLSNVRHGGFIDTGNKVELSGFMDQTREFAPYADGRSFLLIDRTGAGNFDSKETLIIPNDEWDAQRGKIIFNNIFWDTDKNGKDCFTFGYLPVDFLAEITPTNPTCSAGKPQKDGKITIDMELGTPCFDYELTDSLNEQQNAVLVARGAYCGNRHVIDSLKSGTYTLTITQPGGLLFSSSSSSGRAVTHETMFSGFVQWRVSDTTSNYTSGFTNSVRRGVRYGLSVKSGQLYVISNFNEQTQPLQRVQATDMIRISRENRNIIVFVNDKQVHTERTPGAPMAAMMSLNGQTLRNVSAGDTYSLLEWSTDPTVSQSHSESSSISHRVVLTAPCSAPPATETAPGTDNETNLRAHETTDLKLYQESAGIGTRVTAEVKILKKGQAMIAVFDVSGKMSLKQPMFDTGTAMRAEFTLEKSGIYIVKAITADGEFSKKILVK